MTHPAFDDARALHSRAVTLLGEFNGARNSDRAWGLDVRRDHATAEYVFSLRLDRSALRRLEPVAADIANNLIHSLDQIVAGWLRLSGAGRLRVYYPTALEAESFERGVKALERHVSATAIRAMRRTREQQYAVLEHLALVKEASNSSKHWKLVTTDFSVHAVGVSQPGQQAITEVPVGHYLSNDSFDFLRSQSPPERHIGYEVLAGLSFGGLSNPLACDPATAFRCTAQFVQAAIENAEAAALDSE